jgi:hypothetical protein
MTRYLKTQATGKKGINHVKSIIKQTGCYFHSINQENDIGIDAIIELIKNKESTGQLISLQVKSGNSFYNCASRTCRIPIDGHRDFWVNNPLPVFGIVYVPSLFCAYMVDIKKYLLQNKDVNSIKFPASDLNLFSFSKFDSIVRGELSLIVSYIEVFEKLTDSNDFTHFRYLVNYGLISIQNLIEGILSTSNIDECLTFLNYKLVELNNNDIIAKNSISNTLIGPNSGKIIFTKNQVIYAELKGLKLYHNTFLTFKKKLIDASLF